MFRRLNDTEVGDDGAGHLDFAVMETDLLAVTVAFLSAGSIAATCRCLLSCSTPPSRHMVFKAGLTVAALSLTWYAISIGFTLFNKFILRYWHGTGFPFPLSITMVHMCLKWALTVLAMFVRSGCKRSRMPSVPLRVWLSMGVPVGMATALDIMLAQFALLFTTVTLTTIVQSLAIMFNFLLTAFLGLSRFRCDLAVVVLCIMTGVALSSYGDTDFNELGFMCALGSALMAAVRWVVTQKLLVATAQLDNGVAASSTMAVVPSSGGSEPEDRGSSHPDPLLVLFTFAPAAAVTLIPAFIVLELHRISSSPVWLSSTATLEVVLIVVGGGSLAFCLLFVEVQLVKCTSALSLNVIGNVKDVLKILLAVAIFNDHLSPLNAVGIGVTISSAAVYSHLKRRPSESLPTDDGSHHKPRRWWQTCCHRCLARRQPYSRVPSSTTDGVELGGVPPAADAQGGVPSL